MQGQRILDRLANGPMSYRSLEKRVSAKYRKESFKADFKQLLEDNVIYVYQEGRTRFVALSCPGEPLPEPPKSPAVAIQFRNTTNKFHVGDLVLVAKKTETRANGWDNSWEDDAMDGMVGQLAVIKSISKASNDYLLEVNDRGNSYGFPEESLLLVRHAASEVETAITPSLVSSGCGSQSEPIQEQLEPIEANQPTTVETVGARIRINDTVHGTDKTHIGKVGVVTGKTYSESKYMTVRLDGDETQLLFTLSEMDLFEGSPESIVENVFVPDYRQTDIVEPPVEEVNYDLLAVASENPQHGEPGHQHRFGDEDPISNDEVTMCEVDGKIALVIPDRIIADLSKIVNEAFEKVLEEDAEIPVGTLVTVNDNYDNYGDLVFIGAIGIVTGYTDPIPCPFATKVAKVKLDGEDFNGMEYWFLNEHLTVLSPAGCGSSAALGAPYKFEETQSYDENWFQPLAQSVTNKLLRISKHIANLPSEGSGCSTDPALTAAQKTLRQTFKLFV